MQYNAQIDLSLSSGLSDGNLTYPVIHKGTSFPTSPVPTAGQLYFHATSDQVYIYSTAQGNWVAFSGYSGISGYSGKSGYSGFSGISGYSGKSGYSGFSGISGYSGKSGYSGFSGISGYSGKSGYSGFSGISGYSGKSGYSGFSGISGYSGKSGYSGFSGYSGKSGYSGFSGKSGYSGFSGYSGKSGYSGISGYSGTGVTISGFTTAGVNANDMVYVSGASTLGQAVASSQSTYRYGVGVLLAAGSFVQQGNVWVNVDAGSSIATNSICYLSPTTAGAITGTAPSTAYQIIQRVGTTTNNSTAATGGSVSMLLNAELAYTIVT